jgi:RNA polymerase sigma-70 factor (ECF subfamily)
VPRDDSDLPLERARRGDELAIAELYRSLNPLLLRYLRHHVGRVAEDVASDVWLALAPQLARFDGDAHHFRALMFTIARRRTIDHYRRNARYSPTVPFHDAFDCIDVSNPEDRTVARLTAQSAVEALVGVLRADQAEIVMLRVLGDLDVEEVAQIVGKSKGAVRVSQHRALRTLQRALQQKVVTP